MNYLLTMKQLACVAGLINQPVPAENLQFYTVESEIISVAAASMGLPQDTVALYDPQLKVASVPPNYATRTNNRNTHVHEAAHYIFDMAGVSYEWRQQNAAIFAARKYEVFCLNV